MQENKEKKSNFFERISQIMEYNGIKNVKSFACDYLGYASPQKINRLKEEGTSPSFDILVDISNKFENIDTKWLLTGEGEMLKSEKEGVAGLYKLHTDTCLDSQLIPLYEIEASAGIVLFSSQNPQTPVGELSIPNAPKCDGAVYVRGDSMYPILKSGDIVCYKVINDIRNIFWGEMYILDIDVEGEQYLTIKYIQKSDAGDDYVKLVSQNPHHQPKDELKANIRSLALVKASIRYNSMR